MTTDLPAAPRKPKRVVSRRGVIEGRNKDLIDLMVWTGLTHIEAAKQLHVPAIQARKLMAKPHALAYLRQEKQALRSSLGPKVVHRLMALALQDRNPNAAVQACRTLENSPADDQPQNIHHPAPVKPGLVIVIHGGGKPVQTIEHSGVRAGDFAADADDRRPLPLSDPTPTRERP